MADLESQAFTIRENAKIDADTRRLERLADVIGADGVRAKEILKRGKSLVCAIP